MKSFILRGMISEQGFYLKRAPTLPSQNGQTLNRIFFVLVHISESKVEGLYLAEPDLEPSFILLSDANDVDSANTYFDTLLFFPDTTLTELALPLRENQVWGIKTKNDHFAKILIQEVWATSDTLSSNLITYSGSLTMRWEYQPDGSREF
ncbi:MAG: hypothetical protein MK198_14935 [Gracilimonas sp.]|uniref:hypothetical protein n=1 Tax=Gracilimonas sp. TaxID=1974203 RepID=UPI003751B35B|nr:hypothetical protein [Gracilimonas sp.]